MNLAEEAERGNRAARLLAEPLLQEAFASVETEIHERWAQSPVRDLEGQQQLRLMLKLLGDVKAFFEATVTDGKVASQMLDELNNRRPLTPKEFFGNANR